MKKYFYINGKIASIEKPSVLINDIGILRGYGVFDFMRTYNGKIFQWEDHFKRFSNSAKLLGIKIPLGKDAVLKVINDLLKKNKCKEASLRLVLTGGPTEDGMTFKKPTFAILIEDIHSFPKSCYQSGVKLITHEYERMLPQSKNTNYIWAIKLAQLKKKKGATEVLYTSAGKILEASTANLFIIKGATLITPKDGILKGITRKVVLKIARGHFKVEEREVKVSELDSATEAFITGTNKLVMPVVMVDNKKIGDGRVGENTKLLIEEFRKYTEKY
jgi:branched-subunit amino acid aminotransferase/4-amino-4-deoxychorismate lyase